MKTLELICANCKRTFNKAAKTLKHSKKRGDNHQFCSIKCVGEFYNETIIHKCHVCEKEFNRTPSSSKSKSGFLFCSRSCAATWNNKNKSKGTRVSKLEIWISKELAIIYPNLEFHFNRKDAIASELDIYIPSLKLAFELNGIFHYEPIFGDFKLQRIIANDNNKFQNCIKNNIELCIIDVSGLAYFKIKNAQKYLNIITNIIDSRLIV
jgi:hypothetical protein